MVDECVGELAQELVDAGGIFLLALVAVVLEIGMGSEVVEAVDLGLMADGPQGLAVGGDGEGHVTLTGLDDFLGEVVALVALVVDEADGLGTGVFSEAFGDGSTDQGGGIDGGRRGVLGAGEGREQEREHRANRQEGETGPGWAEG